MNQWKELEDRIKKEAEAEQVPESLSPEAMKKKLEEQIPVVKKNKKINYVRFGSMAAALLIVFVLSVTVIGGNSLIKKGKNVEYKGTIVADEESVEMSVGETNAELVEKLKGVASYSQIYNKITDIQEEQRRGETEYGSNVKGEAVPESMNMTTSGTDNLESDMEYLADKEYSTTNLQEEGVGEADSVITDGEYIYIQKEQESVISIVKADGSNMKTVSKISVGKFSQEEEQYLHEFYVAGDKLFLMTSRYEYNDNTSKDETVVITYDISDRTAPKEISRLSQSGSYASSRLTGGYLYVFSDYGVYGSVKKEEPGSYVPLVSGEALACEDIFMPEEVDSSTYKVVTSVDITNPTAFVENRSVLCGSGIVYVSNNNIYFTSYHSVYETDEDFDYTEIWKFTYDKGQIVGTASGKVKGEITDQFALHESNGYLRLVTTYQKKKWYEDVLGEGIAKMDMLVDSSEDRKNGLYVLDANLSQVGVIEDLAPEETIYSARFFENTAYFVTFRQTDPLFSVDLTDPANPKLLGELKIPGFSEYLHPYGDGLLLGIGYDADNNGRQTGIKLTMFDVSDPANVKELTTHAVTEYNRNNGWASSDAMYNHKQILVDVEKNIIGFSYEEIDYGYYGYGYEDINRYVVYGYDKENGFYEKMNTTYSCMDEGYMTEEQREVNEKKRGNLRGLYIDKYFYTINQSLEICCYDMEQQFKLLGQYEY